MLFWTPILEYIKIRPSPISKLSPDALQYFCLLYSSVYMCDKVASQRLARPFVCDLNRTVSINCWFFRIIPVHALHPYLAKIISFDHWPLVMLRIIESMGTYWA